MKIGLKKYTGFTLIELLVTIAVLLTITGGGIAAFVNFNDRQQVQVTVRDIQTLMRAAQVKARAGEGAIDCDNPATTGVDEKLRGYQVVSTVGAVVMNRVCVNPNTGAVTSTSERSRVTLTNVTVTMPTTVEFLALRGGVRTGDGSSQVTVTVAGEYSSYEYEFDVLSSGEIMEGAFN